MASGDASRDAGASVPSHAIGTLLERWQQDHDPQALDSLVTLVRPPLERAVALALRRRGIRDPAACDDVMTKVLDHLARMGGACGGPAPAVYDAARGPDGAGDPGWVYVLCVARSRARDVSRSRRRRDRHQTAFSGCDPQAGTIQARLTASEPDDEALEGDRLKLVQAALERLEPRQRTVIELLLEGKSQSVVAHVMGVCEGTVSRLRARAVEALRRLLVT